jgi:hypothetical protein
MEPVLTLTYYAQLREQMRSWMRRPTQAEPTPVNVRTQTHLFCTQGTPQGGTNTNPEKSAAGAERQSEVTDLDEAFEAITEKINFHWPKISPSHRVKAGIIKSTLGLLLFIGLILLMEGLLR